MWLYPISLLILLFSFASLSFADENKHNVTTKGIGCSVKITASSVGFNANFYDYTSGDLINFDNSNFVANGYTTRNIYASATGITEPNFSFNDQSVRNASIYNIGGIYIGSTVIQLTGYFVGMYLTSTI